jgi:hypothetical protein
MECSYESGLPVLRLFGAEVGALRILAWQRAHTSRVREIRAKCLQLGEMATQAFDETKAAPREEATVQLVLVGDQILDAQATFDWYEALPDRAARLPIVSLTAQRCALDLQRRLAAWLTEPHPA